MTRMYSRKYIFFQVFKEIEAESASSSLKSASSSQFTPTNPRENRHQIYDYTSLRFYTQFIVRAEDFVKKLKPTRRRAWGKES